MAYVVAFPHIVIQMPLHELADGLSSLFVERNGAWSDGTALTQRFTGTDTMVSTYVSLQRAVERAKRFAECEQTVDSPTSRRQNAS